MSSDKTYEERVDVCAARWVYSMSPEEFSRTLWCADELDQDDGKKWDFKAYHRDLKAYLSTVINTEGTTKVQYSNHLNPTGRQYAKTYCVQKVQSRLRSLLVRKYVVDVDMVNAHPSLLLYLCEKKYDIPCTYLKEYITNRAGVLEKHGLKKFDVLKAINSDKVRFDLSRAPWFKMFSNEMLAIRKWFWDNKGHKDFESINFNKGSKDNPKASVLNRVLCAAENKVLQVAVAGVARVDTLIYDGFHLDKGAYNDQTIPTLNKATEEFGVIWSIKPFDTDISVPSDFDWKKYVQSATDYVSVKFRLEQNNAKILEPPMFVSRADEDSPYFPCTEKGFKHKTSHFVIPGKKEAMVPVYSEWMMDRHARSYKTIDFVPDFDKCPADQFNLFTGFPRSIVGTLEVDPETGLPVIDETIREHLFSILADGDIAVYKYILDYMAHLVQRPCERPEVCFVLKGGQGTGKDSWVDIIEQLVGTEHCHRTSKISDMVGNFNQSMFKKLVYQLDEMSGKNGFECKEEIKHNITCPRYDVNSKHKDVIGHTNYLRIIMTTNNHTPVEIPYDDRRFFVNKVSNKRQGDRTWWNRFHKTIRDPQVMDAFYTHLMNRDISAFNPKERPITSAYRQIQEKCIHDVYKVLRDTIENGSFQTKASEGGRFHYFTPQAFKLMYKEWLYEEGFDAAKDYPRSVVIAKLEDIEGFKSGVSHRWKDGGPVKCYRFDLKSTTAYLKSIFAEEASEEADDEKEVKVSSNPPLVTVEDDWSDSDGPLA